MFTFVSAVTVRRTGAISFRRQGHRQRVTQLGDPSYLAAVSSTSALNRTLTGSAVTRGLLEAIPKLSVVAITSARQIGKVDRLL